MQVPEFSQKLFSFSFPVGEGTVFDGNEKADFLAKKGVLFMQKVSCSLSFHSIKNLIKRSIKARALKDICNRVSHKSWWNTILNLRNGPRRRAVTEFLLATGHDCLRSHLYKIKVA
ncbi:hypothetical protein TNIN_86981 [Trichonephila inaurata madagascariensis]|uniref:Uncharacterized protein n=1 Tax=Trichonephila inaurata madagascariensis TaxID=2747483 RepID=A0A8X7CQ24_9ARAC|nr:hypothetical protein TNIN_86981 [Trichonephila inaurata madagascariensis]